MTSQLPSPFPALEAVPVACYRASPGPPPTPRARPGPGRAVPSRGVPGGHTREGRSRPGHGPCAQASAAPRLHT